MKGIFDGKNFIKIRLFLFLTPIRIAWARLQTNEMSTTKKDNFGDLGGKFV